MGQPIDDFGEVLFEFPVLYSGWEGDEKGYIVKAEGGSLRLIMSSHGRLYVAEPDELQEKITEYKEAIDATHKAISLLRVEKD